MSGIKENKQIQKNLTHWKINIGKWLNILANKKIINNLF